MLNFQQNLGPFENALYHDEKGDPRAASLYRKAIAEGDNKADAWCNLGILESGSGNAAKAIDAFANALKEDPRHLEAHFNLANHYAEVGNAPLAKIHYETVIEIDHEFPGVYYNYGILLASKGEYKEAISMISKYRRLARDNNKNIDELLRNLMHSSIMN